VEVPVVTLILAASLTLIWLAVLAAFIHYRIKE
jgi:hypothetical protein